MSNAECDRIGVLHDPHRPTHQERFAALFLHELRLAWMMSFLCGVGGAAFYFGCTMVDMSAVEGDPEDVRDQHLRTFVKSHHTKHPDTGAALSKIAQRCADAARARWRTDKRAGSLIDDDMCFWTLRGLLGSITVAGDRPVLSEHTASIIDALQDLEWFKGGPSADLSNFVFNEKVHGWAGSTDLITNANYEYVFYGIRYYPAPHAHNQAPGNTCCADSLFGYEGGKCFGFEEGWASAGEVAPWQATGGCGCLCGKFVLEGPAECECCKALRWR